jgi:glycerol uptake facilitator-like aquaporin
MIVSGHFPDWWLYVIAPTLGGVLGAFCYEYLARPGSPPE